MNLRLPLQNLAQSLKRLSAVDYFLIASFGVLLAVVVSTVPSLIYSLSQSHASEVTPSTSSSSSLSRQGYSDLRRYEADLKNYEQQLKLRSEMIGTILREAEILEYDVIPRRLDQESSSSLKKNSYSLGVGGGDEPIAPIIVERSSKIRRLTKQPKEASLLEVLDSQLDQLRRVPLGTPVNGRISSTFGHRYSPFSGRRHNHTGLDIAVDTATPVYATADGVILAANYKGAYGKAIVIDHQNGIQTLYGHLSKIGVKIGESVCKGQKIGFVGSTGRSTGPHLHYEVRVDGKPKNPEKFVQLASFLQLVGIEQVEPEEL